MGLALYGWLCLRTPDTYRWLDSLDLAVHEAVGQAGWLAKDQVIGGRVYFVGVLLAVAIVIGWRTLAAQRGEITAPASPG